MLLNKTTVTIQLVSFQINENFNNLCYNNDIIFYIKTIDMVLPKII